MVASHFDSTVALKHVLNLELRFDSCLLFLNIENLKILRMIEIFEQILLRDYNAYL